MPRTPFGQAGPSLAQLIGSGLHHTEQFAKHLQAEEKGELMSAQVGHLLEHARLAWQAEEENARRLAVRTTFIVSGVVAVLGLTLLEVFDLAMKSPRDGWAITLLLLGSVWLLGCTGILLPIPKRDNRLIRVASRHLRVPGGLVSNPLKLGDPIADEVRVLWATYDAFLDLQRRNIRAQRSLHAGQRGVLIGMWLGIVAVLVYLFAAPAPTQANGDRTPMEESVPVNTEGSE